MSIVIVSLSLFAVSLFLTGAVRRAAVAKKLLDVPNQRSSHTISTPRGGGLAILVSFIFGLIWLIYVGAISNSLFIALVGSTTAVAVVGFWDDFGNLSQKWRFSVHIAAAVWVLFWLEYPVAFPFFGNTFIVEGWGGYFFLGIALVWVINLFNFMDGIDGLATSEVIFVSLSSAYLLKGTNGLIFVAPQCFLAAASLGFLYWNRPPSKIFMGDVASGSLGIILGVFALSTSHEYSPMNLWSWLILFALFIVDATFTLLRRMIRKEKWYSAHCSHGYQHAARKWGHFKTATFAGLINLLWLFPLAWLAQRYPGWGIVILCVGFVPLLILAYAMDAGKGA